MTQPDLSSPPNADAPRPAPQPQRDAAITELLGLLKAGKKTEALQLYRETFHVEALLPKVKPADLLPEPLLRAPVQLYEPLEADGNVSVLELVTLVKLAQLRPARRLFEFGTFDGRTTLNLAGNLPEAEVYTLDLPKQLLNSTQLPLPTEDVKYADKELSGDRYRGTAPAARIVQLYGDSAAFDFSPFYDTLDFVFVDAAHTYDYVLNDSRQALKLLRRGRGIIAWHDYQRSPGVTQALNELYQAQPEFKGLTHIQDTTLAVLVTPDSSGAHFNPGATLPQAEA